MKLVKGDQVLITTGKDRGKKGKIIKSFPGKNRVVVEGVNILKKHSKPTPNHPHGGVIDFPAPIDASNTVLICGSCTKPTRVKIKKIEDGAIRICSHCQGAISSKGK